MAPEEFTVHHVSALAPELISAARTGESVCLDLSAVSHIDTAGIQLLLVLRCEANRSQTQFDFINPSAVVSDMADFYQLDGLLCPSAPRMPA
jgi:ABC-type transporter Mla MlaB component